MHHGVAHPGRGARAAAVLSRPLRDGPLPPRQGHRPDRRGGSRLRIEIDSLPTEIDVVTRRIRQLEIERSGPAEGDRRTPRPTGSPGSRPSSATSREQADRHDRALAGREGRHRQHPPARRRARGGTLEAERARTRGGPGRASEIRYGRVPDLDRRIEAATDKLAELQSEQKMLKEEVDAEDVAEVVSSGQESRSRG